MKDRKKQIWLRQDQIDLIVACLQFCRAAAYSGSSASTTLARRELMSRIDAVRPLFGAKKA